MRMSFEYVYFVHSLLWTENQNKKSQREVKGGRNGVKWSEGKWANFIRSGVTQYL